MTGTCQWCGLVTDKLTRAREIISEVAEEHQVPRVAIVGDDRHAFIVSARACAIRRIREETGLKLTAIGDLFGLDHSTITHHLNSNENGRRATDAAAVTSRQAQG